MKLRVVQDFSAIKNISHNAKKAIDHVMKDEVFKKQVAELIKKDVIAQTRLGKSIPKNRSFKPLSEGWIKTRQKIITYMGAPNFVSPSKSNLSLSGQLLDSLDYKITKNKFEIRYFFAGTHRPYYYQGRRKIVSVGGEISNQELAEILSKERPFFDIRDQVNKNIVNAAVDRIKLKWIKLNRGI